MIEKGVSLKQFEVKQQISHKPGVLQTLIAFNHLVELETINKPIAVCALGLLYSVEISRVGFNSFLFFGGLASVALILSYVMAINDCFDVEEDKIKNQYTNKKLVVSVEISVRDALVISVIMLFVGLTISWFVSQLSFFVGLTIVIISTLYSVPPVKYKYKFPYSTLGEIAGSFLPFLFGVAILGSIDYRSVVITPFFALTQVFWRLIHERRMRDIDLKTGKRTIAIKYGERVSRIISRISVAIAIFEALVLFLFGWLSPTFLFFLGLFYLFGFGFWYYLQRYTPRIIHNAIGPTWGVGFVLAIFLFIIYLR
jgi:4-hydroxybenzoate polyprenyltransferase